MIWLFQFELKKFWTSIIVKLFIALFFLAVLAYYAYVHTQTIRVQDVMIEINESKMRTENQLSMIEDQESEEALFLLSMIDKDDAVLKAYEEERWYDVLAYEVELYQEEFNALIAQKQYYTVSFPTLFTMETRNAYFEYMQQQHITPVLPVHLYAWKTQYDELFPINDSGDDPFFRQFVEKQSTLSSSTSVYFLYQLSKVVFSPFGVLFFLLLFSDIVTKEGLYTKGSIQLLRTQPLQHWKIPTVKMLVMMGVSLCLLMATTLLGVLLGIVFDRVGDWDYPVLIYGEAYAYTFIPMWHYLLKSILLFGALLLFSYSLLFMFSYMTKQMITAIGLTVATFAIGIMLSQQIISTSIGPYLPFHYASIDSIMTMSYAIHAEDMRYSFRTGGVVLLVASCCILISIGIIQKVNRQS